MFDKFDEAAAVKEFEEILRETSEMMEYAWMLTMAVTGTAICLVCKITGQAGHEEDIIQSISPEIREEALRFAPSILSEHGKNAPLREMDRILDFTPETAWPLALMPAIYSLYGLRTDGTEPRTGEHIFNVTVTAPGFSASLLQKQWEVASTMEEELTNFAKLGAEKIREHINYPYEINPMWLFLTAEKAQESGIYNMQDFDSWFMPCFEEVLAEVREELTAANTAACPQNHYN